MKRLAALAFALSFPLLGWAQCNSYNGYAAGRGTFSYSVDGVAQSKPIQRMVYSLRTTVCR